jgi:Undecaprenyl-phosphate glucose phosphotransferase
MAVAGPISEPRMPRMSEIEPKGSDRPAAAAGAGADRRPVPAPPRPALSDKARSVAESLARPGVSPVLVAGFARLIELAALVVTGLLVYFVCTGRETGLNAWHVAALACVPMLAVFVIQASGGYTIAAFRGTGRPPLLRIVAAWTLVFAIATAAISFAGLGDSFPMLWLGSWYFGGLAAVLLFRTILSAVVNRWTAAGLLDRRAVIVGGGTPAEQLIRALEAEPGNDIRICGIFDDRKGDRSPAIVAGYPKLGTIAELVEFGRIARVDLLIVTLPITAESRVLQLLKQLWVLPVDIRLSLPAPKLGTWRRAQSFVGKVPFLDMVDKPIADWDVVAKWLVDRILGFIFLLLALPVMLVVALAIKLDSRGPVLFRQPRYGFNNELIDVYKFRSMYVEASDAGGARQATKNDPRVTRVGRFIRKTSLDELPQLFNVVLKGNLSLVGPRPHPVHAKAENRLFDEVVDGYFARHRVKPGITGWAQINGWRGETDTREKLQQRIEHDLDYIENWSVLLDLYIIALTPFRLLKAENAY